MLNCKSAHLIFCQEKLCSEMVFHAYLRQFDGVVAMVTYISNIAKLFIFNMWKINVCYIEFKGSAHIHLC